MFQIGFPKHVVRSELEVEMRTLWKKNDPINNVLD